MRGISIREGLKSVAKRCGWMLGYNSLHSILKFTGNVSMSIEHGVANKIDFFFSAKGISVLSVAKYTATSAREYKMLKEYWTPGICRHLALLVRFLNLPVPGKEQRKICLLVNSSELENKYTQTGKKGWSQWCALGWYQCFSSWGCTTLPTHVYN